jgi:hypothetical protein
MDREALAGGEVTVVGHSGSFSRFLIFFSFLFVGFVTFLDSWLSD